MSGPVGLSGGVFDRGTSIQQAVEAHSRHLACQKAWADGLWSGTVLGLSLGVVVLLVVMTCAGCVARYEADNGPRGPERVEVGPPWNTEANPCDGGCAPR